MSAHAPNRSLNPCPELDEEPYRVPSGYHEPPGEPLPEPPDAAESDTDEDEDVPL